MAEYIAIPKLGMQMTEATLVEWRVKEGERVEKDDIVLLIETEKTEWEVEASTAGFVHILVEQDVVAPIGRVVGFIAETEEELADLQKEPAREIFTTAPEPAEPVEATKAPQSEPAKPAAARAEEGQRVRISPVARRMAEEHMIDISTITGTGPDGRIVREDIQRAIEAKPKVEAPRAEVTPTAPAAPAAVYEGRKVKETVPFRSMRKAIAEHMHRSLSVSAQLTITGEIDMTAMVNLRKALVEQEEAIGARVTYTDLFVLVITRALKDNPIINSSLVENEIKIWEDINIGIAVALERGLEGGLIVPVVKNADQKSLSEISREARSLVEKARDGKLMPDDVAGGTFTITNLGAVGGGYGFGTPIINQPESAILATGAITDRPVVREGQIVIRPIMTYSLTFDHRVIDGATGSKFMLRVTQLMENPALLQF
jgi:pyruvate dehydrogenase E2 component (dihydrolipoamide acetyltransferase)